MMVEMLASIVLQAIFGWPAIIAVAAFSVVGLVRNHPLWLFIAGVCSSGPSFYLAGTPLFRGVGLLFPAFLLVAGLALGLKRRLVATALALAPVLIIGFVRV